MRKSAFITIQILLVLILFIDSNAQVVRKTESATAAGLNGVRIVFSAVDLGGQDNGIGGSYPSGYREVDFEDWQYIQGGGGYGSFSQFGFDYYNKHKARGLIINAAIRPSGFVNTTTISFPRCQPGVCDGQVVFKDTESDQSHVFKPFSGTRMLGTMYNTSIDISFRVPGTNIPATTKGFGMIFADVDLPTSHMTFYDENGKEIFYDRPDEKDEGFSFLGASFNDGRRIARVNVVLGWTPLARSRYWYQEGWGADPTEQSFDFVAGDNIVYGEPRALEHHPADFDGDGGADTAVFRPSTGGWYVLNSGTNTFTAANFGMNGDVPVDGDFDGDAKNDYTVFRPSDGTWYSLQSSDNQFKAIPFGLNGDKPVPADYDKDRRTDIAVWRPSDGNYYSLDSSTGNLRSTHWGAAGDIPIGAK